MPDWLVALLPLFGVMVGVAATRGLDWVRHIRECRAHRIGARNVVRQLAEEASVCGERIDALREQVDKNSYDLDDAQAFTGIWMNTSRVFLDLWNAQRALVSVHVGNDTVLRDLIRLSHLFTVIGVAGEHKVEWGADTALNFDPNIRTHLDSLRGEVSRWETLNE